MFLESGPKNSPLLILVDYARPNGIGERKPLAGFHKQLIERVLNSQGFTYDEVRIETVHTDPITGQFETNAQVIVALGEGALQAACGEQGLEKKHLSVYKRKQDDVRVIGTFHPERITKDFTLNVYAQMTFSKARDILNNPTSHDPPTPSYLLDPTRKERNSFLEHILNDCVEVAVDIETSKGQINTVGFAVSPTEAIAIRTLPKDFSERSYYDLWRMVGRILEDPSKWLILQNAIYEKLYFARYGIRMIEPYHDTMWAQKFLWPELDKGLDNIGRMYTKMPYWKEDNKDWNSIKDWHTHLTYNCKDTTGTFQGMQGQRKALEERGLSTLFYDHVMEFSGPLFEMCINGLPLNLKTREALDQEVQARANRAISTMTQKINHKSPKQKLKLLHEKGMTPYKVYDQKTKSWKESTNELSLKRLRLKHPEDPDIKALLELAKCEKALSSYIRIGHDDDGRVRYSLSGVGTETGRWSSHKDPWGRGMNAQTLGSRGVANIKSMFETRPGWVFLQCDLKQAESRFVAYDAVEERLISMLENGEDVHRFVAGKIYNKPTEQVTKEERQLGKKSGHGANYAMKETTFMDSCLKEMDLVIDKRQAKHILETYHEVFPGIRSWHESIKTEVIQRRHLITPIGRVRHFYGMMNDDTFREAFAYRPQSTIPDIINCLMLHLWKAREEHAMYFKFILQVHDSLLFECPKEQVGTLAEMCSRTEDWHPEIILPAGKLVIPTEIEVGKCWGKLKEYTV